MDRPIEIRFEGQHPIILFPNAITSIVYQQNEGAPEKDRVVISLAGGAKPITYDGVKAKELYRVLFARSNADEIII